MQVKQIYEVVNTAVSEALGKTDLVAEDLSNIVDVGTEVFNADAVDNYVKALVDRIGKVLIVNRRYQGFAPKILMDDWEYGSVVEKIRVEYPDATENKSWELVDGQSYDLTTFVAPKVAVKFFNSKTSFEVKDSIAWIQVKESFIDVAHLTAFISAIETAVANKMTQATDALVMRAIDNMIGETIADGGKTRAINVLELYNTEFGETLTADTCLHDLGFLKYASTLMKIYIDRIQVPSTLFNVGGTTRFTPKDLLHVVLLSDYVAYTNAYLQADTWHNELTALPGYETVPYWQATGTDYTKNGRLSVVMANGETVSVTGKVLGVIFDRDALGVTQFNKRVRTFEVGSAEFTNYWYKQDASYFNDLNENFLVFYVE